MPRYYFDIDDGQFIADKEGLDLPGPADAREQTKLVLGELALHLLDERDFAQLSVEVRDSEGRRMKGTLVMMIENIT
ncbi:DUF6894 family protein [Methylobacterium durans]|uniref:DUF6894 domain-containing protein n=1 Tax=Methylobacterium durans TaxID=2202825 RepID=A0A2U8WBY0_9HYPH|nr:hypothetical protein [Methylobacterium durans]AWN43559.1 hypothetical protein DK389_27465 [Methylobacterium durans]